ncbi:Wzz/FepE/Etk N-terminal domain-containing protein [Rubrivivax sp. RP6-9]|uniref:Wzz/FepE/Etk N-terminal domain-containing protein n=1 Tax=Rubrivivax sp. RP6-9 TaxID=3415750 RepID=UPI003CC599D3
MDISRLMAILGARWRAVVLAVAAVLALTLAVHAALPPRYTAAAAIVLDVRGLNPVLGVAEARAVTPRNVLGTQASMVRSDGVARQVVRRLRLVDDPAQRAAWQRATQGQGDAEAWIAARLLKSLDVRPAAEDSNVLDLQYAGPDAVQAAAIVNAFADAYLATALSLRSDPARVSAAFFTEQAQVLRAQLEVAQSRLSAYQRQNGIVGGDERLDVETASLNALSALQIEARAQRIETSSRSQQAQARAGSSPDVLVSPVVQQLLSSLAAAQARLQVARGSLGAKHPQLLAVADEVAQLQTELDREVARAAASLRMGASINEQREASLRGSLEAQRRRVLQLKTARDGMSMLERDAESARKAYEQVQLRLVQTRQESSSPSPEASILSVGVAPSESSRPGLVLLVPLGLALGTVLGVLVALLLDRRRPLIHYPADLRQWGVPLLAVVPHARLPGSRSRPVLGAPA